MAQPGTAQPWKGCFLRDVPVQIWAAAYLYLPKHSYNFNDIKDEFMVSLDDKVNDKPVMPINVIPEDIGIIVDLITRLKALPTSKRIFKELHDAVGTMIDDKGSFLNLFRRQKAYSYDDRKAGISFCAIYYVGRDEIKTFMTVEYRNNIEGIYLNVTLERQKAALTGQIDVPLRAMGRIDKAWLMDRFLKGHRFYRAIVYVPHRLLITDGKENIEHSYNLHPSVIPLK